jgi:GxxExxY protein
MKISGLMFKRRKPLPVVYKDVKLDCGYRIDFVVENLVIVEIKAVETLAPIHSVQLLTYLRLYKIKLGLLINFNVPVLKEGIKRVINGYF